jgi:hypothetical protein
MIKHFIYKALNLPPHVTLRKASRGIKRVLSEALMRLRDMKSSSFATEFPNGNLLSHFQRISPSQLLPYIEIISSVTKQYLDHRFDLLGSGWVQVNHALHCRGLEGYRYDMRVSVKADPEGQWLKGRINKPNLNESQRIWQLIFETKNSFKQTDASSNINYVPIDWHLDFKSGYRWQEDVWYRDIQYGYKTGVDIKVPWELSRMQHLPQLAFAHALAVQNVLEKLRTDSNFTEQTKTNVLSKVNKQATESEKQINGKSQLGAPEQYVQEFRSQVLDFIACNPPRFSVNWVCTMDVAIRVANWLIAYDLFRSCCAKFDEGFERIFIRSVYEHGLHIINNLEWAEEHRNNHYLSDIIGLLIVAIYLPRTPEIDAWLAFAVHEFINEVEYQFYPEGSNFESSTSYHRLSAEIVTYATTMVLGLQNGKLDALKKYDHTLIKVKPGLIPSPLPHYKLSGDNNQKSDSPFPPWYFERLEKMAEFTMHITKPNNHISQIGDNDSGRFFKFQSVYNRMTVAEAKNTYLNLEGYADLPDHELYWDEDFLDHRHLVAAINGLFGRADFDAFTGSGRLETDMIMKLAGNMRLSSYKKIGELTAAEQGHIASSESEGNEWSHRFEVCPEKLKQTMNIPLPDGATDDLKLYVYPAFGLYIYRSKRFYLSIRCRPVGKDGNSGHAHNDQLSIELNVDGKDWITDPGTYLYTPLPDRRNEYRSAKAHFAPHVTGKGPSGISISSFIGSNLKAEVIYFSVNKFIGKYVGFGKPVYRLISIKDVALSITDFFTENCLTKYDYKKMQFSPAYGKLLV